MRRRRCATAALVLGACSLLAVSGACTSHTDLTVPARLSDDEFWSLSASLSEPAGEFTHSDNLVSNEPLFAHTVRLLDAMDGVYVGVGPEQNYTYIAALRPAMAFVVDIRRENLDLHLMYKALFALSADRADFVARLFSRARPAGLGAGSSVQAIFEAIARTPPSGALALATSREIRAWLIETHGWPLSVDDARRIEYAVDAFYRDGPGIHYNRSRETDTAAPTYQALMTATDIWGDARSYLASEDAFAFVKDLHARNLIVPVVGDFSGPRAIRGIGDYVRRHGAVVAGFYASNVEVYLSRAQSAAFCANLAALPADARTVFIGSKAKQPLSAKLESCAPRAPREAQRQD
jgi:hypothetical protein